MVPWFSHKSNNGEIDNFYIHNSGDMHLSFGRERRDAPFRYSQYATLSVRTTQWLINPRPRLFLACWGLRSLEFHPISVRHSGRALRVVAEDDN